MKKILFLTFIIAALAYPTWTLLAQDSGEETLTDVMIVEPQLLAAPENVPATTQAPVKVPVESKALPEENIAGENLAIETADNDVMIIEAEAEIIERVSPRNPETDIIVNKQVIAETNQNITPSQNPLDAPIVENTDTQTTAPNATHPQLNLTEDKSEMIRLNQKAASVIVGNPNHISVLLDTPDTLIVVPRQAGASHFTVIGEDGKIIMQRHVIVGAPKDDYVRIRRSCNAGDSNCQQTSVYYCPNTCHEVIENAQTRRR